MFNLKQRIKDIFNPRVMVLMYHRIADEDIDPWQLAVSRENFKQHLELLQQQNLVMPLHQIFDRLKENNLARQCVALTFDDGYADNYSNARPLLEKYDIPATFFITSGNIDSGNEFWWDELAKLILLSPHLPPIFSMEVNGHSIFFELGEEASLSKNLMERHKHISFGQPGTLRSSLYYKLWEHIGTMCFEEQRRIIEKIRNWIGVLEDPRPEFLCLTTGQIRELAGSSLFNVGGHSVSHPALPCHDKEKQLEEILGNKVFLENHAGKKIDLFAYPSGKYNTSTIEVLKELDFRAGFTTQAKTTKNYASPFTIGRFGVNNWTGDQLEKKLCKWYDQ